MGRDSKFACRTCRLVAHLGYGSYRTWEGEGCLTAKEWDRRVTEEGRRLEKNRNVRRALAEHEGHDFDFYSTDWTELEGGDLVESGPYGAPARVIVEDVSTFREEIWDR